MSAELETKLQGVVAQLQRSEWREDGQRQLDVVLNAGGTTLKGLLGLVTDPQVLPETRITVAWLLGRLHDKRARPALTRILMHETDGELRAEAARSLGLLGSKLPFESLKTAMFSDEDASVRESAAIALGLLGDRRAVKAFIAVLDNPSESSEVRGSAAEQLGSLGSKAAGRALASALSDSSAEVRYSAALALAEIGDVEAVPALEKVALADHGVLKDGSRVSEQAAEAMLRIRSRVAARRRR